MKWHQNIISSFMVFFLLSGCSQSAENSVSVPGESASTFSVTDPYADYYDVMCKNAVLPTEEDIQGLPSLSDSQKKDTIAWIHAAPPEVIEKSKNNSRGIAPGGVAAAEDEGCAR